MSKFHYLFSVSVVFWLAAEKGVALCLSNLAVGKTAAICLFLFIKIFYVMYREFVIPGMTFL
jgi:hypothetical protein